MRTLRTQDSPRRFPGLAVPAAALILLAALSGCFGGGSEDGAAADSNGTAAAEADTAEGTTAKAAPKEKSIRVNTGQIRRGELVIPVYADGAIRTPQSVEVKAKVGGQVTEVLVRDGVHVKKGQLLAQIDPREYRIALEESRYRHLQALSQMAAEVDTYTVIPEAARRFDYDQGELKRQLERGHLTRGEYDDRLMELEMSALKEGAFRSEVLEQRTGLADARMAEDRAKLNLDYTQIKAPFAGVVQGLTVVQGEILSPNAPICSVFDNSELEATVNVLEADLGNLTEGRPALLTIPATGETLETSIDVISPNLDAATRTCEVILRFANPEGRLRPGMFVRAQIAGWVHRDKLLAPKDALLIRDSRTLVFKKEGDRAKWLYVDTGLQNDNWVEITAVHSGGSLAPGDDVVVSDHLTLAHEAKITVRKQVPPENRWAFAAAGDLTLYRSGEDAFAAADYEAALVHYEDLLRKFPASDLVPAALYKCRACLLKIGRNEEAWDHGGDLLKRFPDSPEAALLKNPSGDAQVAEVGGARK